MQITETWGRKGVSKIAAHLEDGTEVCSIKFRPHATEKHARASLEAALLLYEIGLAKKAAQ